MNTITPQMWERISNELKTSGRFIVIDKESNMWSCKNKEEAQKLGQVLSVDEIGRAILERTSSSILEKKRPSSIEENLPPPKRLQTSMGNITCELTTGQKNIVDCLEKSIEGDYNKNKMEEWKKTQLKNSTENEFHQSICLLIDCLIISPTPISLNLITAFYKVFFESHLKEISKTFTQDIHVCEIINDLYHCFSKIDAKEKGHIEMVEGDQLNTEIFFLKKWDEQSQSYKDRRWVVKPTLPEGKTHATTISCSLQPKRELMAHVVNFHRQFPIPQTLLLQFEGKTCSIQRYIEGKVGLSEMSATNESQNQPASPGSNNTPESSEQEENLYLPMEEESFHCLLIFDLLFSNGDRHTGNLIFTKTQRDSVSEDTSQASSYTVETTTITVPAETTEKGAISDITKNIEEEKYSVIGIDHGDCMILSKDELEIDYLELPLFTEKPFVQKALDLVQEPNEEKYAELMSIQEYEIPEEAVTWMRFVCKCMRQCEIQYCSAQFIAKIFIYLYPTNLNLDDKFHIFQKTVTIAKLSMREDVGEKKLEKHIQDETSDKPSLREHIVKIFSKFEESD